MTAKKLRAVTPNEKPAPKRPETLKAAIESTERDLLVTMRQKVATEIDNGVPAHALRGLMQELRDLDKQIRALDARTADEHEEPEVDAGADDADFDASAI